MGRRHSIEIRERAFELYVESSLTLRQIAATLEVGYGTVKEWHKLHKWRLRRQKIEARIRSEFENKFEDLVVAHQPKVAAEELKLAERLRGKMSETLDELDARECAVDPQYLLDLTRAAGAVTQITNRILGFTNASKPKIEPRPGRVMLPESRSPTLISLTVNATPTKTVNGDGASIEAEYEDVSDLVPALPSR